MQPTTSSIQKLLQQKLNIYTTVLTPKTELRKDLNLVDWEMHYLLNAIEQTWNISITQKESDEIVSMKHLMEVVKQQLNTKTRFAHY